MTEPEAHSPQAENRHHRYIGNHIPWWVHLMWVSFWFFAIWYVLRYLFPAIQSDFVSPP
jgi:hypothetical protein